MNLYTVEELYRLAQDGNTEALVLLGLCYKEGRGIAQDTAAAARCFYSAAKAGYASGQYQLGLCYEEGCGLEQDQDAAAYWYHEAAARFYEAARLGSPQAQYGLGNCYSEGRGVAQDQAAAVYWYQAAAQQDYADAQYNLGYCYLFGIGVEANEVVALKWYQSAASQGDPQMQHNLGLIYKEGYGDVAKNYGKAAEWFFKAARQGYSRSKVELALIYFRNPAAVKDVSVAERLMTEAAQDGIQEAQIYLMHYYFDRDPAKKDIRKAYSFAVRVVEETKDPTAYVIIGTCCADGDMFEKDEALAYSWLHEVEAETELLSGEACYHLGRFYQEGIIAEQSFEKASHFYGLSQKKGYRLADEGLESLKRQLAKKTKAEAIPAASEEQPASETRIFEPIRSEIMDDVSTEKEETVQNESEPAVSAEQDGQKLEEKPVSTFERLKMQIAQTRRNSAQDRKIERAPLLDEDDQMLIRAYEDDRCPVNTVKRNEADAVETEQKVTAEVENIVELDTYELEKEAEAASNKPGETNTSEVGREAGSKEYEEDLKEYEESEEEYEEDLEEYEEPEEEYEEDLKEYEEPEEEYEENLKEYEEPGEEYEEDLKEYEEPEEEYEEDLEEYEEEPEETKSAQIRRNPVMFDRITDMEEDLVDYEDVSSVLEEEEEEDEEEEWESSDDNFIASLLATGARVTNTSVAVPKKGKEETETEKNEAETDAQGAEADKVDAEKVQETEANEVDAEKVQETEANEVDAEEVQETEADEVDAELSENVPLLYADELNDDLGEEQFADEIVTAEEGEAAEEISNDMDEEPEADNTPVEISHEPISRRIAAHIPIHEVLVCEDDEESELPVLEDEECETGQAEHIGFEQNINRGDTDEAKERIEDESDCMSSEDEVLQEVESGEESDDTEEIAAEEEMIQQEISGVQEEENIRDALQRAVEELSADEDVESGLAVSEEAKRRFQEKEAALKEEPVELSLPEDYGSGEEQMEETSEKEEAVGPVMWESGLDEHAELPELSLEEIFEETLADVSDGDGIGAVEESESAEQDDEDDEEDDEPGKLHWFWITLIMAFGSLAVAVAILLATGNWPQQWTPGRQLSDETPAVIGIQEPGSSEETSELVSEAMSEEETSEEVIPEESSSLDEKKNEEMISEEFSSEELSSEEMTSEEEIQEETASMEAESDEQEALMLEETTPEETTLEEITLEETTLEETTPEETTPEETTPEETTPEETTPEETTPEETKEDLPDVPVFSDTQYQAVEVPYSGCVYAKLCSYDEKDGLVYAGKLTEMDMPHVAEFAHGMNVIGNTVYYCVENDEGGTVYYVPETGGTPQTAAASVPKDIPRFIMNNSIFAGSREYVIGESAQGAQRNGVDRFLTFSLEYAYYLTPEGKIARSPYDWSSVQELKIDIDTAETVWAQVIGRYLLMYNQKYEMLYSYDMADQTIVQIPFEGIAACDGLAANGNWVYGIYEGELVRVRPNGSELETVLGVPDEGAWKEIVHVTEHFVIAVIETEEEGGEYLIDLKTKESRKLVTTWQDELETEAP